MHEIDENKVLRDALSGLTEEIPPMPADLHAAWMQKVEDDMTETRTEKSIARKTFTRFLSIAAAMVFLIGGTLLTRDDLNGATSRSTPGVNAASMKAAGSDGIVYGMAAEESSYDASAPTMMYSMARSAGGTADNGVALQTTTTADPQKKIIRTASLTIATRTYDESLSTLRALCEENGGWIESSSESTNSGTGLRTARLTLRIPQEVLDSCLESTAQLGRITSRSESATDVTASYQDTQARLETQLALMERLQALITESASLSDLLALESQIADTQYTIDALQSSLNSTDRQVSYSSVSVTLKEETVPDITDSTVSLGERIGSALRTGWVEFVAFLQDLLVFIVAASPLIAVVAVVWISVAIIRARKRRNTK